LETENVELFIQIFGFFTEKNTPQPKARGPAIPKKRARKVKAMEFGSDDE